MEVAEKEQSKQQLKFGDTLLIDQEKIIAQMWRLLSKFKVKCLMFLLVIRPRSEEGDSGVAPADSGSEIKDLGDANNDGTYG